MSDQTIFPALRYRDAAAAIDWLERAFGFERHGVHNGADGTVAHAELRLGNAMIMLGTAREGDRGYASPPPGGSALYVVVDEVDALHERARAAGAEVGRGPVDTDYGSREVSVRDLEGNTWSFGTYQPWAAAGA
jgi:uncharacterized glyoxalase superfamily protein PhnB